jgi:hypothetical protein
MNVQFFKIYIDDEGRTREAFKWFGSYLLSPAFIDNSTGAIADASERQIMVRHLRGRKRTFIDNPSDYVKTLTSDLL